MSIGSRIKQRRTELGLSQMELAYRLGVSSKSTICKIETGVETNLTTDRISKYAHALNTNPAFLMGLTDNDDPNYTGVEEAESKGTRDAELLSVIRRLNDTNSNLLLQFAKTLLNSQES